MTLKEIKSFESPEARTNILHNITNDKSVDILYMYILCIILYGMSTVTVFHDSHLQYFHQVD